MTQSIHIVDAFTEQLFAGNPAAVVIRNEWYSDDLMQKIASENNLAETAFLVQHNYAEYAIRWFSPLTEIDFCGHATLAASSVIFETQPTLTRLRFKTSSVGDLIIEKKPDGKISMTFPIRTLESPEAIPHALLQALPEPPVKILRSVQAWHAIYDNEQAIYNCQPDLEQLKQLAPLDLVVSAPAENYDFVSRYFWPANGGDEDPVTGSIHASLAPWWAKQLGKSNLLAHQASRRGGTLYCEVQENNVIVSGYTKKYLTGEIIL
ncbi:PhzF family phenazine biosynthesis protein [Planctobacterium marinum]|uniref:Phenazine biosynthesis protein PhzF n=1 Tax=Planctobacterium marinum TaxID=1631968 RepID=A0AA48HGJ2_9ALTE|nr:phenazine biosynthesis protein PhzF [Planctobacterium marinum]